jgi:hypothetical protein
LNPAKDKNPMTHDLAEQILQLSLERCMTHMYLVGAQDLSGDLCITVVEACTPGDALELWARDAGYYDADPDPDLPPLDEVHVALIPETCGHRGVVLGPDCL